MPCKPKKKKRTQKANLKLAYELGLSHALEEAGMSKEAGIERGLGKLMGSTSHLWAPAAVGGIAAGPEHRVEGAIAGAGLGVLGKKMGLEGLRRMMFEPGELQKAMQLGKTKRFSKLKNLQEGSRGHRRISAGLGEEAPEFWQKMEAARAQGPAFSWGGRLAGGAGGGLLAKELLSGGGGQRGSTFQTAPAISDISTHYTGLVPGEDYY